jgi:uncharacterized protein (DUF2384 family)
MTRVMRIKRIQKVLDRLIKKDDHGIFWETWHPMLHDSPRDLVKTDLGYQKVRDLLRGMETGDFS